MDVGSIPTGVTEVNYDETETTVKTVKLPTPEADGKIYVSEYLLDRWTRRGLTELIWIDRKASVTGYTINGQRYQYDGVRLAPKVNARRRTFFQTVLVPISTEVLTS